MAKSSFFRKCAAVCLALFVFASPAYNGIAQVADIVTKGEMTKSFNNAKQIGLACQEYANDNDGNFPPSLDALFPTYLQDRSILTSPIKPSEPVGYIYTPGLKDSSPAQTVLIEDKFAPAIAHRRIVVHVDMSVGILTLP